ncbi:MAG: extracellular solute-binding protein [Spirochaetales bacterium]|nr:extracellular solute-binding protein [Spirochaetales bacterium]
MKEKVTLLLLVVSLLSGNLIWASGGAEEASDSVTELTWWNLSSRKELTERVVADFNAAHPDIQINAVLNSTDDHKNQLMVAASSGSLPDMWFNWGGTLGSFYPENGLSYDLSDYAKENNWSQKYDESALSLATLEGQLAGVPTSIAMIGMFYRKDIFEECGVTAPETFEEFETVLATLKSKGYTPLILCGKGGWHLMRFVEALIEMYGGSAEHDRLAALDSSWNSEPVIKAFAKFKEYVDLGYLPEGFVTLGGSDAKSLLYAGDGVIDIEGPWMESNIYNDEQDPDLYGYFKLPLSPKGNRMSGFVEMLQLNANLSDRELEAAITFIEWFYSPESINTYGALIKQPVPRKDNSIPERLVMTSMMIDDLNTYGSYTISDQGLPQEIAGKLFEAQDSVGVGIMTPEEAAAFMQKEIEAYKASK